MKKGVAIQVTGLGKKYAISETSHNTLRDQLVNWLANPTVSFRRKTKDFWALKDVTFEVGEGEVVGVIGKNGSGKSTLLKILSRITEPTKGEARLRGRVSSLLEVGTGFNPELTGRENVFLNGSILGMSRREIRQKFDEIVDFSGVEKFIDTPVKRYSSGMKVRLAFAVAAHLEPEILLVDEVLAVGDAEFQEKSLGKMRQITSKGRSVIFVSHSMQAIKGLCDKVVLLDAGRVVLTGEPARVVNEYLGNQQGHQGKQVYNPPNKTCPVWIRSAEIKGFYTQKPGLVHFQEPIQIDIEVQATNKSRATIGVGFTSKDNEYLTTLHSVEPEESEKNKAIALFDPGITKVELVIEDNVFSPGHVLSTITLFNRLESKIYHVPIPSLKFEVLPYDLKKKRVDHRRVGLFFFNKVVWKKLDEKN